MAFALASGTGGRGSSVTLDPQGLKVYAFLDESWRIIPENETFRDSVLETMAAPDGTVHCRMGTAAPPSQPDSWFETAWARFRDGAIYS